MSKELRRLCRQYLGRACQEACSTWVPVQAHGFVRLPTLEYPRFLELMVLFPKICCMLRRALWRSTIFLLASISGDGSK